MNAKATNPNWKCLDETSCGDRRFMVLQWPQLMHRGTYFIGQVRTVQLSEDIGRSERGEQKFSAPDAEFRVAPPLQRENVSASQTTSHECRKFAQSETGKKRLDKT
eukprot:c8303_g1_i2.p1 GENE.c8303_g1_i2~~c8303_g1_i2.p1  ORF type:complete len:106 (+),score=20.33 c8303_g1_i2:354-671(+)